MKTVTVVGKTLGVISLNKIGGYIRGQDPTILSIDTPEKEAELNGLIRAGLVTIDNPMPLNSASKDENPEAGKGSVGRPKGSRNKIKKASESVVETKPSGEDKSNQMGSRVVVGTGGGVKEGNMKYSAIDDLPESEKTQASLDAMKSIEEAEKSGKSRVEQIIDESKLDASEQMGRKAVVSNHGQMNSEAMKNSILPNAQEIKDRDPFIDGNKEEGLGEPEPELELDGGSEESLLNENLEENAFIDGPEDGEDDEDEEKKKDGAADEDDFLEL